jgi:hypothetical protein
MTYIRQRLGSPDKNEDDRDEEVWSYPGMSGSSGPNVFRFDKSSQTLTSVNCQEF